MKSSLNIGNVLARLEYILYVSRRHRERISLDFILSARFAQIKKNMKPKPELTTEAAWINLQEYFDVNGSKINIYNLFQQNPKRFENFR